MLRIASIKSFYDWKVYKDLNSFFKVDHLTPVFGDYFTILTSYKKRVKNKLKLIVVKRIVKFNV